MKILMVCLGNICRSPIAHGLLKYKVDALDLNWEIDSAGTSDWHKGELPHEKSMGVMKKHGIDIRYQSSRPITKEDLKTFDIIYVMDSSNYNDVISMAESKEEEEKINIIMNEVNPGMNEAVPDPWSLSDKHYEEVFQMLDKATDAIIERLAKLRP